VPAQLTSTIHHPAGSAPSLADRHPEDQVPTYQYACTECGHRVEAVQAFTDDSLTVCPVCSGSLRKVYGSVGVVFKGSGFYRTDSRAAATSTAASNGSGDKPASGDKAGATGDKKVAATAGSGGSSDSSGGSKPAGSSSGSSGSSGSSSSSGGSSGSSKAAAS
jgi:putative FmdB family regulatory protein